MSGFLNESGKLIGYVLPGLDFSPFLPLTPENTKWQEECLPLVLSGMESVESLFFFELLVALESIVHHGCCLDVGGVPLGVQRPFASRHTVSLWVASGL